ncbi:MAG: threonine/serine exporter family protein [Oscillospiraceae bacterium]|nr:threonine/serine exporter family protein [Oscillospiraceae bacterium]
MDLTGLIQIFTGFLGSLGFSILFNIRGRKLWVASLGGLISWTIFLLLEPVFPGEASRYFFAAAAVTVYSEVFARILKTPTTTFLVSSIVPLIPGGSLYYTMNYALNEQWDLFVQKAFSTLELALALAVGIIAITTLTRMQTALRRKLKSPEFHTIFH